MDTEAEWRFINSEIQKLTIPGADAEWHIGLVKRNTWKGRWASGWPLTIAKWQSQEPSADKRSNAAVISKASQGLFKAVPHSLFRPFICEFPSGKMKYEPFYGKLQTSISSHIFNKSSIF